MLEAHVLASGLDCTHYGLNIRHVQPASYTSRAHERKRFVVSKLQLICTKADCVGLLVTA